SAGNPSELFEISLKSLQPVSPATLHLSGSGIWSISPSGEMAIAEKCTLNWSKCMGTLALRDTDLKAVHSADWDPRGEALAVAQFSGRKDLLQYPVGRVLYQASGWIGFVRVSPKGDQIAFLDYSILGEHGGTVSISDFAGNVKHLTDRWGE